MKKHHLIKFLLLIPVLSMVLGSCSSDDKKRANELVIDGLPVAVAQVYLTPGEAREDHESTMGTGYVLVVASEGLTVVDNGSSNDFEGDGNVFFISLSAETSTTLREGTYTFNKDEVIFPNISWGGLYTLVNDEYLNSSSIISEGTIKVSKSGSTYTIVFDLTLDTDPDGETPEVEEIPLKGYYKGTLEDIVILF